MSSKMVVGGKSYPLRTMNVYTSNEEDVAMVAKVVPVRLDNDLLDFVQNPNGTIVIEFDAHNLSFEMDVKKVSTNLGEGYLDEEDREKKLYIEMAFQGDGRYHVAE